MEEIRRRQAASGTHPPLFGKTAKLVFFRKTSFCCSKLIFATQNSFFVSVKWIWQAHKSVSVWCENSFGKSWKLILQWKTSFGFQIHFRGKNWFWSWQSYRAILHKSVWWDQGHVISKRLIDFPKKHEKCSKPCKTANQFLRVPFSSRHKRWGM